jgi:8-oxo-dGTP pyrophosphatase MutT (NUDIX family)
MAKFDKNHQERVSRLPADARAVHTGPLYRVWQWIEPVSGATYELAELRDAALVLAERDGHIFFAKQAQHGVNGGKPFYSLLGGYIDDGEKPLAAAKRELREEGGMISHSWQKIYENNPNDKLAKTDFYYIARNCEFTQKPKLDAGEKFLEVCSLPIAEFIRTMPFRDDMRDAAILRSIFCKEISQNDIIRMTQLIRGK